MSLLEISVNQGGADKKIDSLISAIANKQPMYSAIGQALVRRINLCFRLGIDPWGNTWAKIKFRAPSVQQQAIKDKTGSVTHKNKRDKDGNLVLTKAGKSQFEQNEAGTPGQPLRDTGRLQRSITSAPDASGVTVGTNLIYARLQNFGGTIVPVKASRLVFPGPNGALVFAKKVTIPGRPFMPLRRNQAIVDLPPDWNATILSAISDFLKKSVQKASA